MELMNKIDEYREYLKTAYMYAQLIGFIPIPNILNAISHTEALGPILDPTLYREKMKAMEEDKKLLETLLPIWKLMNKINLESQTKAVNVAPGLVSIQEQLKEQS
jgi:hypothetical protein